MKTLCALLRAKKFLVILAVLIGMPSLTGCFSGKSSEITSTVQYNDIIQRVTVPGVVTSNRKTMISAPYSGYIQKIYVHLGQKVNPGDPVVSITQSLRNTHEEIFPLRAPFSGTVVQILRTEGEYVDITNSMIGNSIIRIDDISKLLVETMAPEAEVSKLKEGQEVEIKVSALMTRNYHGKIKSISLASKEQKDWSDKARVEFAVLMTITDPDASLLPGMSVIVDITTQRKDHVLSLPHETIQKHKDKYFVITQGGIKKEVQVGLQNEELFEIRSGVTEGEKVKQNDFISLLNNSEEAHE